MFIRVVDEGLEKFLREELPLPAGVGDVSFDAPNGTWSAQLSRVTVNLFLYGVGRSTQPMRSPVRREDAGGGTPKVRPPQPMVQLNYLVSAWAGTPRDEHQLLGEVISRVAGMQVLPEQYLRPGLSSSVHVAFNPDLDNQPREVFSAAGGKLKACFTLQVSVAADTFGWSDEATQVSAVEAMVSPNQGG